MNIKQLNEQLEKILEQNKNLEPGRNVTLTLYRLGDPQVFELNGVEFYLGEDEELENGIDVCIEEEFLPNWIEKNNDITGYHINDIQYNEKTGDGFVEVTME